MNFSLMFWGKTANEAIVQYFNSKFLGHVSAQDLLKEFQEALKDLRESSMLQVSMDGPSVSWALYDELCKHCKREELPSLTNIGSCGLHIVYAH